MPAASDPDPVEPPSEPPTGLPVRFRPLGVRIVATTLAVLLALVVAGVWVQLPPHVRGSFTLVQQLTLLVIALLTLGIGFALARSRVDADESGVTVVNGYRRHRYDWGQVVAVTMRAGNPWAVLDLSDGTSLGAMGIQASDGERARGQVRRLRALVDARAGREPPPGTSGPTSPPTRT
jgi:hypothetical protein